MHDVVHDVMHDVCCTMYAARCMLHDVCCTMQRTMQCARWAAVARRCRRCAHRASLGRRRTRRGAPRRGRCGASSMSSRGSTVRWSRARQCGRSARTSCRMNSNSRPSRVVKEPLLAQSMRPPTAPEAHPLPQGCHWARESPRRLKARQGCGAVPAQRRQCPLRFDHPGRACDHVEALGRESGLRRLCGGGRGGAHVEGGGGEGEPRAAP